MEGHPTSSQASTNEMQASLSQEQLMELTEHAGSLEELASFTAILPNDWTAFDKIACYLHQLKIRSTWALFINDAVSTAMTHVYQTQRNPMIVISAVFNCLKQTRVTGCWIESASKPHSYPVETIQQAVSCIQEAFKQALANAIHHADEQLPKDAIKRRFDVHFVKLFKTLVLTEETSTSQAAQHQLLDIILTERPFLMTYLAKVFANPQHSSLAPQWCSALFWLTYCQDIAFRQQYITEQLLAALEMTQKIYLRDEQTSNTDFLSSGSEGACSVGSVRRTGSRGPVGESRVEKLIEEIALIASASERLTYLKAYLNKYAFLTGPWYPGSFKTLFVQTLVNQFGDRAAKKQYSLIDFNASSSSAKKTAMLLFTTIEAEMGAVMSDRVMEPNRRLSV